MGARYLQIRASSKWKGETQCRHSQTPAPLDRIRCGVSKSQALFLCTPLSLSTMHIGDHNFQGYFCNVSATATESPFHLAP